MGGVLQISKCVMLLTGAKRLLIHYYPVFWSSFRCHISSPSPPLFYLCRLLLISLLSSCALLRLGMYWCIWHGTNPCFNLAFMFWKYPALIFFIKVQLYTGLVQSYPKYYHAWGPNFLWQMCAVLQSRVPLVLFIGFASYLLLVFFNLVFLSTPEYSLDSWVRFLYSTYQYSSR